jgi:hypothetical protein
MLVLAVLAASVAVVAFGQSLWGLALVLLTVGVLLGVVQGSARRASDRPDPSDSDGQSPDSPTGTA